MIFKHKLVFGILMAFMSLGFLMPSISSGRNLKAINAEAERTKARRIIEAAEAMNTENVAAAGIMFDAARALDVDDKIVRAAINNHALLLLDHPSDLYFEQLNLLEEIPEPLFHYYSVLLSSTPPEGEGVDSMQSFRTAERAYERFPDMPVLGENLLNTGLRYLYNQHYVRHTDQHIDTVAFTPGQIEFAEKLLSRADSIEARNGYSLEVDRTRGAIYKLLDRDDEIRALARKVEDRDSTNIDALDLLISFAYAVGDSLDVNRYGMKRFELMPDGDNIYSLYEVFPDSMKRELADKVLKNAIDTDIDPSDRMEMLQALTMAYYEELDKEIDSEAEVEGESHPLLERVNEALFEITGEDPTDIVPYVRATILARNQHWLAKYGYRNWMNAVDAVTDTTSTLMDLAGMLATFEIDDPAMPKQMEKLAAHYAETRPDLVIPTKLFLAQSLFNNKRYAETLSVLQPIELSELDESQRLHDQYLAAHPDEADNEKDSSSASNSEKINLKKWIIIQTLISESQMNLNRVDAALATLNRIIAIDPENAGALNNLAYYMCENGRDLTIALSLVERSLSIEPSNINALDTRAWINYQRGDANAALDDMVRFFNQLNIDLKNDLLRPDNERSALDILEADINIPALGPILGHLLAILSKADNISNESMERIVEVLEKYEPDNEFLKAYKARH